MGSHTLTLGIPPKAHGAAQAAAQRLHRSHRQRSVGRKNTISAGFLACHCVNDSHCVLGQPPQRGEWPYKVVQSENDVGGWRRAFFGSVHLKIILKT